MLHVAIDLGAGSGRAFVGGVTGGGFRLREVHRFRYEARPSAGRLRWDSERLFDGLRAGLRGAHALARAESARLESVGVDSWAVDYGVLDAEGRLLEEPVCYRDARTDGMMERVFASVPRDEIFAKTGLQFLKLNTLYQLFAHAGEGLPAGAARILLIPDLCHHALCGSLASERTNASTTQLLNARSGLWDDDLFARLGLPRGLMPEVVPAGTELGRLRDETLAGSLRVIAPATHDTASAVAGTPLEPGWAYISSGTWSLVGVELPSPLLGPDVAAANFTNEAGAYATVRLLKNVMGLWLLESCRKEWPAEDVGALLARVAATRGLPGFVFPDAPELFSPESMVRELRAMLGKSGQPDVAEPAALAKVVLDSLALRYASVLETAERLTGQPIPGIHIVGGGSQNDYLNQATADAAGRPVLAGPVEATAAGNLLVQAIACGEIATIEEGRALLRSAAPPRRFEPRRSAEWDEARRRYREIEAMNR